MIEICNKNSEYSVNLQTKHTPQDTEQNPILQDNTIWIKNHSLHAKSKVWNIIYSKI